MEFFLNLILVRSKIFFYCYLSAVLMIDLTILAAFGIILTIGVVGSDILKKIHIPEILGFLLVGIALNIFLVLLNHDVIITDFLDLVVAVTLGLIGFNLGSELDWKAIRSMSVKILVILLCEALLTFFLVAIVVYILLGFTQLQIALLFGALASATAPAGTAAVFWECDAKGPLTTTTMFILALDDVVAILLTDLALGYSKAFYENSSADIIGFFFPVIVDVFLSFILGMTAGLISVYFLNREEDHTKLVDFVIGAVLVCIGIASLLEISYILPTMVFGIVISSLSRKPAVDYRLKQVVEKVAEHISPQLQRMLYEKRRENMKDEPHQIFHEVYRLASPIIAIFFILIGLSLDLSALIQIGVIGIAYMVTRTVAKAVGATTGAYLTKAETTVKKFLGPCLLSQAGVALGLAVIVSEHLAEYGAAAAQSGLFIFNTITASTIIFQIFGPIAIKWAIDRSGEGRVDLACED